MNNVRRVPFKVEHLDLMDLRQQERDSYLDDPSFSGRVLAMEHAATAETVIIDGCLVCICGALPLWEGVIEVFIIPSEHVRKFAKSFAGVVKQYVEALPSLFPKTHRIQTVAIDDEVHSSFLEWCGFEQEGLLKRYTKNKLDYKQWAKLYDGC